MSSVDPTLVQLSPNSEPRKYWRSLDELANTPKFRDWLHREFPESASELVDDKSRRTMLKLMAASFGLAGLTACRRPEQKILPQSKGIEDYIPGKPQFYATAYTQGGVASGLLVECHDGRPTKIEGNPRHGYSLGSASAFAQASLLNLYDPDRAKYPMKEGVRMKWDDFTVFAQPHFAGLGQGQDLRFLVEPSSSPSLAAVKQHALSKYPGAKWIEYEPLNRDEAIAGAQIAFGQPLEVHHQFEKAEVILSLDFDFLGLDSPTILPVKQFSNARRVESKEDHMSRLYVVEPSYTVTGGMADHRLRSRAADVRTVAAELLKQLGGLTVLNGATTPHGRWIAAAAKDLKAHAGKSLVVAGPRQPAAVHALVALINQQLGNLGQTVTYTKVADGWRPQLEQLKELAADLAAGRVKTLVILGGNPVYTAPTDLALADKFKQVPVSILLSEQDNETAAVVKWALPETHYLETWGDALAADGTPTVQQPMIEPLYEGKSKSELLALLTGYKDKRPYDIVRNQWFASLPGDKEKAWRKALHDGIVESAPKAAPVSATPNAQKVSEAFAALKPAGQGTEVNFFASAGAYDGRFSNNAWMQEAPEPMTKLTWDNAALLSPATAKQLGVESGDLLEIAVGGAKTPMPALIQPGHADNSISISLGYGRTRVGRVGNGVGHNAGAVRTSDAFWFGSGSVAKTGRKYPLSHTQEHFSMEGRPIVREATLEHFHHHPDFAKHAVHVPKLFSLYDEHTYEKGAQWGMVIDLNTCIGCNACVVACQSENNIPVVGKDQVARGREMHWIRLDRYYSNDPNDPQVVTHPMACQQCESAPCEVVCPVAATVHSPEGLNEMAYNRCVGTRYCANNCPYKVRRFNFLEYHKDITEVGKMAHNPDVSVRMRGVMEKCNYCVQRIQEARIAAKADGRRPIRDGEVKTACMQTCPADAIVFGNINDPESRISKLRKQDANYGVLEELNTRPRTTYLAKLRNPNPELA
ncbi:MAG: TAT-variant-translocated molybdopterin oxidoreductase [Bryobacteraceae bacterium]|nr:TAT-variant-translocated molybdopterin oxidoreductase [Bryobacteraceae bacterium]